MEDVHKISSNSSPVADKPVQVMDVKPPAPNAPIFDNSIAPEESVTPVPVPDEPSSSPTSFTPAAAPTPATTHPATKTEHTDAKPAPKPSDKIQLTSTKIAKILAIIIVALILIALVLYFYMKKT